MYDTPCENLSGRLAAVAAGSVAVVKLAGSGEDADEDTDIGEDETPAVADIPCVICCIICAKCCPTRHLHTERASKSHP